MEKILGMMFEGITIGIANKIIEENVDNKEIEKEENVDNKEIEKEENKDPISELLGGIINGLIA